jgi:hypothetical protein
MVYIRFCVCHKYGCFSAEVCMRMYSWSVHVPPSAYDFALHALQGLLALRGGVHVVALVVGRRCSRVKALYYG